MIGALVGFLIFNKVPAKVFPGDILTYSVGALMVGMAVLGNFEKMLLIIYIPYFFEVVLKLRGHLHKQSFGKVNDDGSLSLPYEHIYGLTHFSIWFLSKIKSKVYEKDVVYFLYILEIIFIIIALINFMISFI
jgi:UDP-N-acetylglucosamine--dolichyl-phosphate N-acetylglucosaminephosphotransferase